MQFIATSLSSRDPQVQKGHSSPLALALRGSTGSAQRFKWFPSIESNFPINVCVRSDLLSTASNFLTSATILAGSSFGTGYHSRKSWPIRSVTDDQIRLPWNGFASLNVCTCDISGTPIWRPHVLLNQGLKDRSPTDRHNFWFRWNQPASIAKKFHKRKRD